MPELDIYYAEEWAALYVDGQLEVVGDSYLAEERAFELLGVHTHQDDSFMRGQEGRALVAQTLAELEEYRQQRAAKLAQASALRADAERLLGEAAELERR